MEDWLLSPRVDTALGRCSRSFNRIFPFNRIPSAQPLAKWCHSFKIFHLLCKQQNKCLDFLLHFFPQNFQGKLQEVCESFLLIP